MPFLDRIASAVLPAATEAERSDARRKAEHLAVGEPWLRLIVEQHKQIEVLFAEAKMATSPVGRSGVLRKLAALLTGHALAEEAVIYPIVSEDSGKTHASMAYEEHAMTKVQISKLERMDPATGEWLEKLEHIRSGVAEHVYQEESSWLPDLVENAAPESKAILNKRFVEEFERYCA